METSGSDFLPLCCYDKSPKTFDEKLSLALKRIDELIERNKKSSQKMIADDFSPGNPVSTDPQKIGCEEALIEESSMSTDGDESQQFVEAGAVLDSQVSLQTKNSKSFKEYKCYSTVELDDWRDRGLCLWCDEFWYIGHDCCKNKKCYVLDIDADDAIEVNETDPIESRVDVTFVDEGVSHCETKLLEDCVENDSTVGSKCEVGNENWESSEALGKYCLVENHELHVFDKMCEKNTLEDIAEKCVVYAIGSENEKLGTLEVALEYMTVLLPPKKLWLYDEGCGKLLAIMLKTHSPSVIEALFSLLSRLGGLHKPWIALPELPIPPPEPPPRIT